MASESVEIKRDEAPSEDEAAPLQTPVEVVEGEEPRATPFGDAEPLAAPARKVALAPWLAAFPVAIGILVGIFGLNAVANLALPGGPIVGYVTMALLAVGTSWAMRRIYDWAGGKKPMPVFGTAMKATIALAMAAAIPAVRALGAGEGLQAAFALILPFAMWALLLSIPAFFWSMRDRREMREAALAADSEE